MTTPANRKIRRGVPGDARIARESVMPAILLRRPSRFGLAASLHHAGVIDRLLAAV